MYLEKAEESYKQLWEMILSGEGGGGDVKAFIPW